MKTYKDQVINYANNSTRASSLLEDLNKIPLTSSGSSESPRFHAIQADVSDKASVNNLVAETVKKMGRLDVVVSNAGWTRLTDFMKFDEQTLEDDWDKCFLYNVKSHLWLATAAKPHLEETEGAFVTTASIAGVKPSGSSLPYSVTKAALIHLTKGLAVICAPKIRINSVSPGLMLTEWGMKFPKEKIEKSTQNSKLKRLATVEVSLDIGRFSSHKTGLLTSAIGCGGTSQRFGVEPKHDWTEHCLGRRVDSIDRHRPVSNISRLP